MKKRTNKARVAASVARAAKSGRSVPTAADLSRRLKIDPGQVRRILGELGLSRRRPTRSISIPSASVEVASIDEIKERIASYLAETAGTSPLSSEILRETLLERMTRGPHLIRDAVAVLNEVHAPSTPRGWFRPFDLARELNAKPSTVRDALVNLREEGRAEHDPSRGVAQGRWRMIGRPEGFDEGDVAALIPKDRSEQDKIGLRIYEDPRTGEVYVVAYDPGKHYGGPAGAKSHHKKVASVGTGGSGGRALALSMGSNGRWIPVLSTPLDRITVIDRDDGTDRWIEPAAFGFAPTPRGHHAYLDPRFAGELQDPTFETLSRDRGAWHERLFSDDGKPRSPPRPVWGSLWTGELAEHWFSFLEAQQLAERMRYA